MFEELIIDHAKSHPHEEVCGFVLLEDNLEIKIEPAKNESPKPRECFSISPLKFIDYKLSKNILGIYHSHPITTERPSKRDMDSSEESGIPYLIYSLKTKKFFLYYPESYEPSPLLQRPHVKAFYECTCILKDYFKKVLDINISKWNRNYWLPEAYTASNDLLLKILKEYRQSGARSAPGGFPAFLSKIVNKYKHIRRAKRAGKIVGSFVQKGRKYKGKQRDSGARSAPGKLWGSFVQNTKEI